MSRYSATGAAWQAQRLRVLTRDGWTCTACGKPLEGSDATVDHVSPVSLDPGHDYTDDELVAMCRRCNSRKNDRVEVRIEYAHPDWFPAGLPQ